MRIYAVIYIDGLFDNPYKVVKEYELSLYAGDGTNSTMEVIACFKEEDLEKAERLKVLLNIKYDSKREMDEIKSECHLLGEHSHLHLR